VGAPKGGGHEKGNGAREGGPLVCLKQKKEETKNKKKQGNLGKPDQKKVPVPETKGGKRLKQTRKHQNKGGKKFLTGEPLIFKKKGFFTKKRGENAASPKRKGPRT